MIISNFNQVLYIKDDRLYWKSTNKPAGYWHTTSIDKNPKWVVVINDKRYAAARVAYCILHFKGYDEIPSDRVVLFRDGNPQNMAYSNLVLGTKKQVAILNSLNTLEKASGGVSRRHNKFRAAIYIDGRRHPLGNFDTQEEAHNAYVCAFKKHLLPFIKGFDKCQYAI